jgi:hypothetical protein
VLRDAVTARFQSMPFRAERKSVIVATKRNSRAGPIVALTFFPRARIEANGSDIS